MSNFCKADRQLVEEVRTLRSKLAKLERVERIRQKPEQVLTFETACAEKAHIDSEAKYKNLFDNSIEGIGLSKGNRVISANKALLDIFGYDSFEEFSKVPLLDHVAPESRDLIQERMKKRQAAEPMAPVFEYKIIRKDGKTRDLEASSGEISIKGGKYTQTTLRDITERKRVEEALRESEERYRSFVQNLPGIAFRGRMDFIPIFFHGAAEEITGYTESEFLDAKPRWDQIVHPEDLPGLLTEDGERLRSIPRYSYEREYRIVRKDGAVRWVHEVIQNICDDSGKPTMMQGTIHDITERKQAEEELQKLAAVVRHSTELVNLATLDGKMIFLNEAGSKMLGIEPDEVEQVNIMQVIPDHLKQLVNTEVLPTLKDSRTWEGEFQYRNLKTGELTDVHAITFTVQDPLTSEPLYLANVSRDITDRKQAENELRQAKEFIDNAINAQIDTFFVFNPKTGKAIRWNENFSKVSGYTDEEISAMKAPDSYYDEDDVEKANEGLKELAATGSATIELSLITKNGKRIPFEYKVSLIEITGGENIAISIGRDITERKRAEEQVERIFNMTGYMVCVADLDGSFIRVNSSFEQILGYSCEELLKRPYLDLIHPDDKDKTIAVLKENLSRGMQVIGFENRYRCKDGSYKWLSWTSRPVVEEGVTYAIAHDITDRKTAREEADQHQMEAAHATRLSSIGEMASTLAHELNQPLCAILTHAEGCLALSRHENADMEKLRSKLSTVAKQAERAGAIISRIRGFTRKGKAQKSTTDLNEVIREVMSLIRAQVERAKILIELNLDEGVRSVPANRVQIEQVILNLVRNGVDAMQDTEPANRKLTITTSMTPENTVEVAIRDSGKGIDKKNTERIFQPFFTTKPEGLGLGLSISQSIVESHSGRLYVKENSDKGATFCLALPAIPEKA